MQPNEMLKFITGRHSPRAFAAQEISSAELEMVFEAARWAPSSYNSQPWRFMIGLRGSHVYKTILSSLSEWNQQWAQSAPVLVTTMITKYYEHNNAPYYHAHHDLGIAIGQLSMQALSQNLYLHHIGGFDPKMLAEKLNIPDKYEIVTVFALGYRGSDDRIPKDIAELTNSNQRTRKPLTEIMFIDQIPQ